MPIRDAVMTEKEFAEKQELLGLKDAELAEELGVSRPLVTMMRSGDRKVTATVGRLLDLLCKRRERLDRQKAKREEKKAS